MKALIATFRTVLLIAIILYSSVSTAQDQNPEELNIIWHDGALGEPLSGTGKEYSEQTGVAINVELVPWS